MPLVAMAAWEVRGFTPLPLGLIQTDLDTIILQSAHRGKG